MAPSPTSALTVEKILAAAEDVVRRHGATRATVVDVAQALGVSHASLYRYFPTKAALRDAVVTQWLGRTVLAQEALSLEGSAADQLRGWFEAFFRVKRDQRTSDPELFEAFRQLSAESRASVEAYKDRLIGQLAVLVERGMARQELIATNPADLGRSLLTATSRFHHPAFASAWENPHFWAEFPPLWDLLVRGMSVERKSL